MLFPSQVVFQWTPQLLSFFGQYGYKSAGGTEHVPQGWDWWIGLVGNSRYYNYTLSINGTAQHFTDQYLTNVIVSILLRNIVVYRATGSNGFNDDSQLSRQVQNVWLPSLSTCSKSSRRFRYDTFWTWAIRTTSLKVYI